LSFINTEFSYESIGERITENQSTFAKIIIKHQVAYFFETQPITLLLVSVTWPSSAILLQRKSRRRRVWNVRLSSVPDVGHQQISLRRCKVRHWVTRRSTAQPSWLLPSVTAVIYHHTS